MNQLFYNEKLKTALHAMIAGERLPHAILIEGGYGTGKKTFARMVAAAVLCTGEEEKPCGHCENCRKVFSGLHPDVQLISSQGGKGFVVDQVRELRADTIIRPNQSDYKIYILCDVQDMTIQAQNALLKTLEEPMPGVIFLLTVDSRMKLAATILSRVVLLATQTLSWEECETALKTLSPDKEEQDYRMAAQGAQGSIGAGLNLLTDEEATKQYTGACLFLKAIATSDDYQVYQMLHKLEKDREGFVALAQMARDFACQQAIHPADTLPLQQTDKPIRIGQLQAVKIADIMEETVRKAKANLNLGLLSAWTSDRLIKIRRNA